MKSLLLCLLFVMCAGLGCSDESTTAPTDDSASVLIVGTLEDRDGGAES